MQYILAVVSTISPSPPPLVVAWFVVRKWMEVEHSLCPPFFRGNRKKESFYGRRKGGKEAPISLALFSTKEQLKKQKGDCNRLLFSFPFLLRFVIGRAEMETERGETELFRLTPFFHLEFNFPRW